MQPISRPANWPTWIPDPTPHDYPEDAADEDNGCYAHECCVCKTRFVAHKRRWNVCKLCVGKPEDIAL